MRVYLTSMSLVQYSRAGAVDKRTLTDYVGTLMMNAETASFILQEHCGLFVTEAVERHPEKQVNLRELYPDAYVGRRVRRCEQRGTKRSCEFERKDEAFDRRKHRNKAIYRSTPATGLKNDALLPPQTPEEIIIARETHEELLSQIASLPDKQAGEYMQISFST